jgi:arginase
VPTLFLLYPEWQGSGKSPAVQEAALTIARELLPNTTFLTIDSPADERLTREDNVIGLSSIGPRFHDALARVRKAAPDRIVTIGGTCGVEAAPIGYLNERYEGDLAVVWLDAHGDLNTPASSPSGHFHGMILRTLLGEGPDAYSRELRRPLTPRQVFLAATRDLDPPERQFIDETMISVTSPSDLGTPERLADRIRAAGFTRVYVHLDLDALNPADFPDTLMRTPGGPPLADVRAAISSLAAHVDLVGFSIVEYIHGSHESLRVLGDLLKCSGVVGTRVPGRQG